MMDEEKFKENLQDMIKDKKIKHWSITYPAEPAPLGKENEKTVKLEIEFYV